MSPGKLWERVQGRYQRSMAELFFRHSILMQNTVPLISFSFDDFPRSALYSGGEILKAYAIRGTYYASLGLMGSQAPTGEIFSREDLWHVLADGHELGCHTFAHCDAWETAPRRFEKSVIDNKRELSVLIPEASFRTLSYPISFPRPNTKRRMAKHFYCCRSGGQTYNKDRVCSTHLRGYFLEQSGHNPEAVKRIIDQSCQDLGWIIFATHDICENPTRYGCTHDYFRAIVCYATTSGARIMPVSNAWEVVCGRNLKI